MVGACAAEETARVNVNAEARGNGAAQGGGATVTNTLFVVKPEMNWFKENGYVLEIQDQNGVGEKLVLSPRFCCSGGVATRGSGSGRLRLRL